MAATKSQVHRVPQGSPAEQGRGAFPSRDSKVLQQTQTGPPPATPGGAGREGDRPHVTATADASVGLLLLTSAGEVAGANDVALQIAGGTRPSRSLTALRDTCTLAISKIGREGSRRSPDDFWSPAFQLRDRTYRCRAERLSRRSCRSAPAYTLLLIEELQRQETALSRLSAEYGLTRRELQTVGLLSLGLTNKEIAGRMGLSCNTVKAFLRSVMAKLRISTRTGVIGALVVRTG